MSTSKNIFETGQKYDSILPIFWNEKGEKEVGNIIEGSEDVCWEKLCDWVEFNNLLKRDVNTLTVQYYKIGNQGVSVLVKEVTKTKAHKYGYPVFLNLK